MLLFSMRLAVAFAVLAAFIPASAVAGTASVRVIDEPGFPGYREVLVYRAAPGERSRVTVTELDRSIRVADHAGVTARNGCRGTDPAGTVAVCHVEAHSAVRVALGDRDDRATVRVSGKVVLEGGAGRDSLRVKRGPFTRVTGGPGADTMTSDARETVFDEGLRHSGDDVMRAREDAWVDYGDRRDPISADMGRGVGGGRGERDVLGPGIAGIRGGRAADRIAGDESSNWLLGGPGADVLSGRSGADVLVAAPRKAELGADRLFGGPGQDRLQGSAGPNMLAGGGSADHVRAGAGNDVVRSTDGYVDRIWCQSGRDRSYDDAADSVTDCDGSGTAVGFAVPHSIHGGRSCVWTPACHYVPTVTVGLVCRGTAELACAGDAAVKVDDRTPVAGSFGPSMMHLEGRLAGPDADHLLLYDRDPRMTVVVVTERPTSRRIVVPISRIWRPVRSGHAPPDDWR